jgi:hypothetical protein
MSISNHLIRLVFLISCLGNFIAAQPRQLTKNKKGKGGKSKKLDSTISTKASTRFSDSDDVSLTFDELWQCDRLKIDYFEAVRKKQYSKTYNPFAILVTYMETAKHGWIREDEAHAKTQELYKVFDIDPTDSSLNPVTIDRKLGKAIGKLYAKKQQCTETASISLIIYRMVEYKLVPHPLELISTFLDETDKIFRLKFYLHNLGNFLQCDDDFLQLVVGMEKDDEPALRAEFLDTYSIIIQGTFASSALQKKTMLTNIRNSYTKTLSLYGFMFGIYFVSTYAEMNGLLVWVKDNLAFYYLNQDLINRTAEFRKVKKTPYITLIENKFNSLSDNKSTKMATKDLSRLGDTMVADCDSANCCPTCKLNAKLEKWGVPTKRQVLI